MARRAERVSGGNPEPASEGGILGRRLVVVLALTAGVAVANLYYAQPLLPTIAREFGVGSGTAGMTITVSQLGYAAGLAFIVPLGDIVDRRRLVSAALGVTAVALAGAAAAPGIGFFIALAGIIGLGSVMAQIVVPLAAELSDEATRGRVVGTVMTGLLLGILLGRTAAGLVAEVAGWRAVYLFGSGLTGLLALVVRRELPPERHRPVLRYGELLRSVGHLVRTEPLLVRRCLYGALAFAAFTALWTSLAFLLAAPPYRYGEATIGLFGLVGAAGAASASVIGRLADAGRVRLASGAFALTIAAAYLVLGVGRESLPVLIAGILVLDLGVTGLHVLNQSTIYGLRAEARSRLNSAYMTAFFLGGAAGSATSAVLYDAVGWTGVCAFGTALGLAALGLWLTERGPAQSGWKGLSTR
ncbi:MAG TPA: MFS transporter [Acidimicrobiia bacterium]